MATESFVIRIPRQIARYRQARRDGSTPPSLSAAATLIRKRVILTGREFLSALWLGKRPAAQ
jgi:hypothetical protein